MRQIRTSGSMSGDGKRAACCRYRAHPRLYPRAVVLKSGNRKGGALQAAEKHFQPVILRACDFFRFLPI